MNDPLTTDQILDVYDHLEKNDKRVEELLADHGIKDIHMQRAANVLVRAGEGRGDAFSIGLVIGLQLGAMRLDPIEYVPPAENESESECDCIACQIRRGLEGE